MQATMLTYEADQKIRPSYDLRISARAAMTRDDRTTVIQGWLNQFNAGDDSAREALFASAQGRLARLARKLLKGFPGVARWEQSDDVLQNALVRLDRSLRAVSPQSAKDFFGLAATQIRRELIDLARHYNGPEGLAAHHATLGGKDQRPDAPASGIEPADSTHDPGRLANWTDFHAGIANLADADRELFDLLWYHGLTQAEAGTILGISERTINKRWIAARLRLAEELKGQLPG
jgi:RNA polymerase sigma factor (sigma-70 family)